MNRFFEDGRPVYFIEQLGQVDEDSVRRLIRRGVLAERSDAMFGVGMSFALNETALSAGEAAALAPSPCEAVC